MTATKYELCPRLPDPQAVLPAGYCDACGGEVYPGDRVYRGDGVLCHWECLTEEVMEPPGPS